MNSLEQRKQLLVAESELNRAELAQKWEAMAGEVRALADQAGILRSLVSAATGLLGALTAWRHRQAAAAAAKPSWLQFVLQGVGLVTALWPSSPPRPTSTQAAKPTHMAKTADCQ
jgi:hypothetical protein